MLARGMLAAAALGVVGGHLCLSAAADAGEKLRPRLETAADAVEYGQQVIQTSGVRPAPSRRAPAVANNRGVVGRDPVEAVDPLEDPFEDPFAEGVPSLPAPKTSRPATKPAVRSQPVQRPPVVDDDVPQPMPAIRSQPTPPRRPPPVQVAPQPAPGPVFSEPAETVEQPVLKSVPRLPTAARQPAQRSQLDAGYVCPDPGTLKKIDQITPTLHVSGDLPTECSLGENPYAERAYCELTYQWKASSLCSKPLYFEDEQLERYGRLRHPLLQPVISGARFYADIALVPYKMGYDRPQDCVYALGYYRPGTCVPGFRKRVFPLDADGVLFEALAVGGFIALIP